ncbi:MAG: hypothetical protein JWP00_945 [Chloroflexi bacterium]|jgi:uncharacterized protein (DUF362 family)|nr:hypothetical protein [Chloroflexota bacterium]
MLTGAIGGSVAIAELAARPLGLIKWLGVSFRRMGKGIGTQSKVAIVNAPSYDIDLLTPLRTAWELIDSPVIANKRVVLKPNIIYNLPDRAINTHPAVIEAAIQLLQEKGAKEIIVAEGTAYQRDLTDLLWSSGIKPMLELRGIKFVDLNHDDVVKVPSKGSYTGREYTWLPKTIAEADLIVSMPKLKTHHWAGATLSMKNLYGIVPGLKYGWPKNNLHVTGIEANIVELYETLAPQLAIVDGIMGMEEDGPLFGKNRNSQILVVGTDLVAVDATCCRLMGIEPDKETVKHIWYADWLGLGVFSPERIKIMGVPINTVRQNYELPPTLDRDIKRY